MPVILDKDGDRVYVTQEELTAALDAGGKLIDSETYVVTNKHGREFRVTGDDQDRLKVVTGVTSTARNLEQSDAKTRADKAAEVEREYGGLANEVATGITGYLDGLFLGAPSAIGKAILPDDIVEQRNLNVQANPGVYAAGEIAGAITPAFGGAGLFGKALRATPAGGVVNLGRAVEAKIAGNLANQTVKRKLAGATIGAATEGAVYGGVNAATDELASDDWTAESVASALGTGALFGGVVGGAVGGVASGVSQVMGGILGKVRKTANRFGGKSDDVFDPKIQQRVDQDLDDLNLQVKAYNQMEDTIDLEAGTLSYGIKKKPSSPTPTGPKKVFSPDDSPFEGTGTIIELTPPEITAMKAAKGKIDDARQSLADLYLKGDERNKFLHNFLAADELGMIKPLTSDTLDELAKADAKTIRVAVRRLNDWSRAQNDMIDVMNRAEEAARVFPELKTQKLQLTRFDSIADARLDRAGADVGITEILAAVGAFTDLDENFPMATNLLLLYAGAKYLRRQNASGALSKLGASRPSKSGIVGQLLGKSAAITTKLDDGINAFLNKGVRRVAVPTANEIYKKISFSPEEKGTAASVPAANLYKGIERVRAEVHKAYSQKEQTAAQLWKNLGVIRAVNPELAQRVFVRALKGLEIAYRTMPKDPAIGNQLQGKSRWRPSDAATHKWAQILTVVEDPSRVVELLQTGKLTRTHVETLQEVSPETYSRIVREVILRTSTSENSLSYEQRAQLSILLGVPVDSSFRPEYVQRLQAQYLQTEEQQAQQAPSGNVNQSLSKSVATPSQARAMGGKA